MYLIQVMLPLNADDGERLANDRFSLVRKELQERFGGLTVYSRAPAEGLWQDDTTRTVRDNIVLFEIMADQLDREWWHQYRRRLEDRFHQEEVVIRVQEMERL